MEVGDRLVELERNVHPRIFINDRMTLMVPLISW
jgi:hypothetical protein